MKNTEIIAEIGNTHEGSLGLAKCFIKAAAETGIDAVKFQTHIFDAESIANAPNPPYFNGESRKAYFERTSFNFEAYQELKRFTEEQHRIEFISSPFSIKALEFLLALDLATIKVPSGEVSNIPLLEEIARSGKRILISSGMSAMQEIDTAMEVLTKHASADICLMQCSSIYPCPPEKSGLNVITLFQERYKQPIGFSDHTLGAGIAIAAVALGAEVVEKHFTLSTQMYGSDAQFATTPEHFKIYVNAIRDVDLAKQNPVDKDQLCQDLAQMKQVFEKSLVAATSIKKGQTITADMLTAKKPGNGIPTKRIKDVIGKIAAEPIEKDTLLAYKQLA